MRILPISSVELFLESILTGLAVIASFQHSTPFTPMIPSANWQVTAISVFCYNTQVFLRYSQNKRLWMLRIPQTNCAELQRDGLGKGTHLSSLRVLDVSVACSAFTNLP